MFDEVYELLRDETLTLTYHVILADGSWNRERIEKFVAERAWVGDHLQ